MTLYSEPIPTRIETAHYYWAAAIACIIRNHKMEGK